MVESNVPATSDESALAAVTDAAGGAMSSPARSRPPGQNVATGLFPLALGLLVVLFLGLAFWTLMTVTGSGL